jgi:hypothetical protein
MSASTATPIEMRACPSDQFVTHDRSDNFGLAGPDDTRMAPTNETLFAFDRGLGSRYGVWRG